MSAQSCHEIYTDHHTQVTTRWADMMEAESPHMPPLFEGLLAQEEEGPGDDANPDLLKTWMKRKTTPPCLPNSLDPLAGLTQPVRQKLGPQHKMQKEQRGTFYDGKRLPPAEPTVRQLLPAVPACMKEMSRHWCSPFKSNLPAKGYSKLEIQGMGELRSVGPPVVESSVAYHLHTNQCSISASSQILLPSKIERLTVSVY